MNSLLVVQRQQPDTQCTLGEMFFRGVHECYTLEPKNPISAGTYPLTIDWSDHFDRWMPFVNDVPGHIGIEIHWGNLPKDTKDCCLVGSIIGQDFIGHSVAEFDILFVKIQDALAEGPQTITYLDPTTSDTSGTGGGN
jgi:hypothetical protein